MSAPKFTSVEAFLAARQVWKPDAIDGDVDPNSPPTVPKTKSEAARRFLCKLLKIQLDGADCAARCVRISARKDSATLCFGCPAGEARAQLLDVTTTSLDQRREERKQAASKASRKDDEKKVAELNKRVTLDSLRKPKASAPRQRPSKPAEAARQVGRKAQAGAAPKTDRPQPKRRATAPVQHARQVPSARSTALRSSPTGHIDWSRVDLSRDPKQVSAELGCSLNAVYQARSRYAQPRTPDGEGWHSRSKLIDASGLSRSAASRRLNRLFSSGHAERTMIGRASFYRPTDDKGRAAIGELLRGVEQERTTQVPDGYDLTKSANVIARELGCGLSTVRSLRERAGVSTNQRRDWSKIDLTRNVQELAAELGVHPDTVYSQRRKRGLEVEAARPSGRGWRSVEEMCAASGRRSISIRRRASRLMAAGHVERAVAGVRHFYRPASADGATWFRDLFDSRPVVTRASVASAPNGLLPMLAEQGAVECRGATNDRAWRVNDPDAVRRAGLHIEQRGRTS